MNRVVLFLSLSFVLSLAPLDGGCGGSAGRGRQTARRAPAPELTLPPQPFPTRASLRASLPPPGPVSADPGVVVAQWDIAPTSLTPAATPFDALYERLAPVRPTAQRSEAFACFATEIARFVAANGGLPTPALRNYVAARCGVTSAAIRIGAFPVDLHGSPSDAQLLAQLGDGLVERITAVVPENADRVGLGIARVGNRFVAATAAALAETEIVPPHPIAEAGHARFVLRASLPVDRLLILANQGEAGVAQCTATGQAPEIAIDCPYVPEGDRAAIEIGLREGEGVMLRPVATLLALSNPTAGLSYAVRSGSTASPIEVTTFATTLLPLVNGIRARAGVPALALDEAQSVANAEVAPSVVGDVDPTVADQVLLYAMAGWEVEASLREGRATVVTTQGITDATSWLQAALEGPIERYVLLDPEARVIAVGAVPSSSGVAALVSTYRVFDIDPAAERERIVAALNAARAQAGLPRATVIPIPELESVADGVEAGGLTPGEALGRAVDAALPRFGAVRGFLSAGGDPARLTFPDEIVRDRGGRVGFSVVHFRPEGAAWGVYLVLGMAIVD